VFGEDLRGRSFRGRAGGDCESVSTVWPLTTEVLSPVAVAVLLLVLLPVLVLPVLAAGGVLEDEPPHAASPTTAAAASTEAANHRLRIVFYSIRYGYPLRVHTQEHVGPGGVVQWFFDESQAAMRWQSQASDSGYR